MSELITCVCCKDETPFDEASEDKQCGGLVCEPCRKLFIKALAYLKHEGIDRPFVATDIDTWNCNRIKNYYK